MCEACEVEQRCACAPELVSVRGHPFAAAHLIEHRLGSPHDCGGREAGPGARVASRRGEEGLRSRCAHPWWVLRPGLEQA